MKLDIDAGTVDRYRHKDRLTFFIHENSVDDRQHVLPCGWRLFAMCMHAFASAARQQLLQ